MLFAACGFDLAGPTINHLRLRVLVAERVSTENERKSYRKWFNELQNMSMVDVNVPFSEFKTKNTRTVSLTLGFFL